MNVVLRAVTVVSTHDGTLSPGMDVHIEGDTIARVTPTGDAPGDAHAIDCHGRYVVPGYLDMHAHPLGRGDPTGALRLMLASGITGYRQMGGSAELLAAKRAGTLPAADDLPALLAMPGMPLFSVVNARDVDTAVATVRTQHEQGADFIKVGDTGPAVFDAVQAEAGRLGIPLLGHLPAGVDVREASRRGMRSIEHLGPGIGVVVACSTDETDIRDAMDRYLATKPEPPVLPDLDPHVLEHMMRARVVNPLVGYGDTDAELLRRADETFDEDRARELGALLAANGTWQCPTLVRVRTMQFGDDPAYRQDPNLRYMATETLDMWHQAADAYAHRPARTRTAYRRHYDVQLRMVRLFDETGVPMLAGSDACGAGWEVPGIALHQELAELASAGLAPLRVLQMTTVDGARFLGATDRMGSVEAGKVADLVVLDADPTKDVRNLGAISGVVRAGRHHDRADLDRIRDDVARTRAAV